jgi:hypothetical protein
MRISLNQYKQQQPPLMQRLAAMAFDGTLPPYNPPNQSQGQSGLLLPSPDIRSGNSGLNLRPRESSDHGHEHIDVDAMKTQEVKGVWEPVVDDDDAPPPPPPKLRARSNSAADLLSASRMAGQEYQFQRQQQQHQYQQQQPQRWPPQYTDLDDDRDISPLPAPPGMRGRSNSAADLLGLGFGGGKREMAGYESQQYQPHPFARIRMLLLLRRSSTAPLPSTLMRTCTLRDRRCINPCRRRFCVARLARLGMDMERPRGYRVGRPAAAQVEGDDDADSDRV